MKIKVSTAQVTVCPVCDGEHVKAFIPGVTWFPRQNLKQLKF